MLRFSLAAATLALAASPALLAQDKAKDKGGHHDHAAMAPGKPAADPARAADKPAPRADKPAAAAKDNPQASRHDSQHGKAQARGADRAAAPQRGGNASDRAEAPLPVRARETVRRIVDSGRDRLRGDSARGDRGWQQSAPYVPVACPPGLAKQGTGCLPPGLARQYNDDAFGYAYRPTLFGIPLAVMGDYAYRDGYLIPLVQTGVSYVPLLGGALSVGQVWPATYRSAPLPAHQYEYYGLRDPSNYRYADNVIYRVDPDSAMIEGVAALLTGSRFTVGQPMPAGYDVYNVPNPFQNRYRDGEDALYRYADGRVYRVDPTSRLIAEAIDLVL